MGKGKRLEEQSPAAFLCPFFYHNLLEKNQFQRQMIVYIMAQI